uniref:Uncharacterized protein n=1 Tax=Romanomermis culicivorax TaxID=13658 RepID=A0A915K9H5_ROMCU
MVSRFPGLSRAATGISGIPTIARPTRPSFEDFAHYHANDYYSFFEDINENFWDTFLKQTENKRYPHIIDVITSTHN